MNFAVHNQNSAKKWRIKFFLYFFLSLFLLISNNLLAKEAENKTELQPTNKKDLFIYPLPFDLLEETSGLAPSLFEYEITNEKDLKMGNSFFRKEDTLSVIIRSLDKTDASKSNNTSLKDKPLLINLEWPAGLMKEKELPLELEIFNNLGELLRKRSVENWEEVNTGPQTSEKVQGLKFSFEETQLLSEVLDPNKSQLRICLKSKTKKETYFIKICSGFIQFTKSKDDVTISKKQIKSDHQTKVLLNKTITPLKHSYIIQNEKTPNALETLNPPNAHDPPNTKNTKSETDNSLSFFVELENEVTLEFETSSPAVKILEVLERDDERKDFFIVRGRGQAPLKHQIKPLLENEMTSYDLHQGAPLKSNCWIKDKNELNKLWEVQVPRSDPQLYFEGCPFGVFTKKFKLNHLPNESHRLYSDKKSPLSTYDEKVIIQVKAPSKIKELLSQNQKDSSNLKKTNSDENQNLEKNQTSSVKEKSTQTPQKPETSLLSEDSFSYYTWQLNSPAYKSFNSNSLNLVTSSSATPYRSTVDVFRAYPGEGTFRLGLSTTETLQLLTTIEISFDYWFEKLASWDQYYFSNLRWGFSFKHFRSLNREWILTKNSSTSNIYLETDSPTSSNVLNLKYRFFPGVVEREENLGALLSYMNFNYSPFSAKLLGIGAFWGKPLP